MLKKIIKLIINFFKQKVNIQNNIEDKYESNELRVVEDIKNNQLIILNNEIKIDNINSEKNILTNSLLEEIITRNPINKNRKTNKIIFKNNLFNLVFNIKYKKIEIVKNEILYSSIPYDTSRKYVQRAAINYVIDKNFVYEYIKENELLIKQYIKFSFSRIKAKKTKEDIDKEYEKLFVDIFYMIQVVGRIFQHYDTGPLSADLHKKFLYDYVLESGIIQYIYHYLKFILEIFKNLNKLYFLKPIDTMKILSYSSIDSFDKIKKENEFFNNINEIVKKHRGYDFLEKPLLKDDDYLTIKELRDNYKKQSINPILLNQIVDFKNVYIENKNKINVVSDIHYIIDNIITNKDRFPINNSSFNVLAGDLIDTLNIEGENDFYSEINGIAVIGNHDIYTVFNKSLDKFEKYKNEKWYKNFLDFKNGNDLEIKWYLLPIESAIYEIIKSELMKRFNNIKFLNNESYTYQNVRYIGLTIPINHSNLQEQQDYLYKKLVNLLGNDTCTKTILISHAPLFNELNFLSEKSKNYIKNNNCIDERIIKLFSKYNILGVIHGHHHIPISQGFIKYKKFANKDIFVICSIFSPGNDGIELSNYLETKDNLPFSIDIKK